MSDLRLVAWLRWRQWRGSARYWLRMLGYDPNSKGAIDRLYGLYLLALGAVWVLAMGAYSFTQAVYLGQALAPALLATALQTGLPWLVLAGQGAVLVRGMRSSPLKLSFADMAWVAGSPVDRAAPVLVNYIQEVIQVLVVLLPLLVLCVTALAQPLGQELARGAAGRAALVAIPLVAATEGVAWLLGLLMLAAPNVKAIPLLWASPILLAAGGAALPVIGLAPGAALAAAVGRAVPVTAVFATAVAAAGAIFLLHRLGHSVDMTLVADESTVFARVNALGVMAWLSPDVSRRIRRQASLAKRKPFLRLPAARGTLALLARSALIYVRRPTTLLGIMAWGFAVTSSAAFLLSYHAGILIWLLALTAFLMFPLPSVMDAYRGDLSEPFLRQLLPVDNLELLLADTAPPATFLLLGAIAAWALRAPDPGTFVVGLALILLLAVTVVICQGAGLVPSFWGARIPYVASAGVSVAGAGLIAILAGAPLLVFAIAAPAALFLGAAIAGSPIVNAER